MTSSITGGSALSTISGPLLAATSIDTVTFTGVSGIYTTSSTNIFTLTYPPHKIVQSFLVGDVCYSPIINTGSYSNKFIIAGLSYITSAYKFTIIDINNIQRIFIGDFALDVTAPAFTVYQTYGAGALTIGITASNISAGLFYLNITGNLSISANSTFRLERIF